jgi:hypothetical protein
MSGRISTSTAFPRFESYRHAPGPHPEEHRAKRCVSKDGLRRRPCKLPSFETPGFATLCRALQDEVLEFEPIGFMESVDQVR